MVTATPATLVTADQLLRMSNDGYRYELVAGELRKMPPAGIMAKSADNCNRFWLAIILSIVWASSI